MEDQFSQDWAIYRIVTHELGSLDMLPLFSTTYSVRQMRDMLEVCDVHDSIRKMAQDKIEAESKRQQKR